MHEKKGIIADAQEIFRDGLAGFLNSMECFSMISYANDRVELFELLEAQVFDILFIDYNQPLAFNYEDLKQVNDLYPQLKIVVLTSDTDHTLVKEVLSFNIAGFLTKDCDKHELRKAISLIFKHQCYLCNKCLQIQLEDKKLPRRHQSFSCLSQREAEILALIGEGDTLRDIADKLYISIHTVRTHKKNIMKKLKVNHVTELVRLSMTSLKPAY